MRTAFDFSPLYRSTVGFDRLFDLIDQTSRLEQAPGWPPYNIEKVGDDQYRMSRFRLKSTVCRASLRYATGSPERRGRVHQPPSEPRRPASASAVRP
jgi:hypothetical protein